MPPSLLKEQTDPVVKERAEKTSAADGCGHDLPGPNALLEHTPHVVSPQPGHQHTHTVIMLHGRDSDGVAFGNELLESETSDRAGTSGYLAEVLPSVRWVFPSAAELYSERFRQPLRQWFDMWSTEDPEERKDIQLQGLRDSVVSVLEVVRAEQQRLANPENIILGGISQGFAAALIAYMVCGLRIGGLVGFSSWMPLKTDILSTTSTLGRGQLPVEDIRRILVVKDTGDHDDSSKFGPLSPDVDTSPLLRIPVFLGHCADDNIVPHDVGEELREALLAMGFNSVEWHSYPSGGHWINEPEGVDDLFKFLGGIAII